MKIEQLTSFLEAHLDKLSWDGGSNGHVEFPDFELTAFDYLDFAESALGRDGLAEQINCVAHLKRAAECQLDTFLHIMNMRPKGKRLSFPRKLELIRPFGVLSPRSLAKLNRLRNKLEHEYASLDETDLDVYFELVTAFAHAVEGFILMLEHYGEMDFEAYDDSSGPALHVKFDIRNACLRFTCEQTKSDSSLLEFTGADGEEWDRAVRIFFLLSRYARVVSANFVLSRLGPIQPSRKMTIEEDA